MARQTLELKQKQQFLLAPQLQQAIHILQLPTLDLNNLIEQELESNPCLEIPEVDAQVLAKQKEDFPVARNDADLSEPEPTPLFYQVTLAEHLLSQLRLAYSSDKELEIGELIIGSLNESGYLELSLEEIARIANVDISLVEGVQRKVQSFEPVGCGSSNARECLLAQLRAKGEESSLEYKIIGSYLDDLAGKRYALLSKNLGVSLEDIRLAVKRISLLEPKPGRQFVYTDKSIYVIPDILVVKNANGEYKVAANDSELPALRISQFYKSLLNKENLSSEERDFIFGHIQRGQDFIRGIKMRQETIRRLASYVVETQQEFFEKGREYIKPLTFKQVALAIERDESTVCRTVANKYMDTPQGVFKLRDLFSGQVNAVDDSGSISSASVKERIRILVDKEDKSKPLSDEDILEKLKSENIKISRRTISKYRKEFKILPSYLRKE